VHASAEMRKWRQVYPTPLLQHPPYSPDLVPIEYIWNYIKHESENEVRLPATEKELEENIVFHWNHLPNEEKTLQAQLPQEYKL
jgi:transposase